MNHLTDDQLYELATKIATNGAFSEADVTNMKHIAQCDECYQMLCCIIAMQDVSMHLDEFAVSPASVQTTVSVQEKITAVIRLAINKVRPILDQIESGINSWSFDAPLAMAGVRSTKTSTGIQKLEDIDDTQTFVAYDPDKKILAIQIACDAGQDIPSVELKLPNGETRVVTLERKGPVLWGEVHGLEDGDYQVLLSK